MKLRQFFIEQSMKSCPLYIFTITFSQTLFHYKFLWVSETTVRKIGHVAPLGHIILILNQPVFALSPSCCVLSGEATNTNFIVFDLIRSGLEPTIYPTWGEHTNHYTTVWNYVLLDNISHFALYIIDTCNTHIHDCSLACLDTDTSITCDRVKLVLWATLILSYSHANSLHTSCYWPFECEMLMV